jgi:transposase
MPTNRARPCTNAQGYGKFGKAARWHWVRLHIDHGWSARRIALHLNTDRQFVHQSTIYECLAIFWRTGDVATPSAGRRSRSGILTDDDWEYLASVLDSRPDLLLDEMCDLVESYGGNSYTISTVCATLQRHGYTRRVLKQLMVRRDLAEEAKFIEVYKQYDASCAASSKL